MRLLPIGDLIRDVRPPDWLVRGYIERNTLALLLGDPEAGKSFCAIDIGLSIACGADWHGARVNAGPVIYVAGEGQQGLGRRFTAWSINAELALDEIPFAVSSMATALTDADALAELDDAIDVFAGAHGWPALIVIDTLNRNFGPGDENSANDVGALIGACDSIRERTRATVLLVHHSGHADKRRGRGSGALRGGVDAEYLMTRNRDLITFEATKMKDGTRPAPITFGLRSVELDMCDDEGKVITSAVLDRTTPMPSARQSRGDVIRSLREEGRSLREIGEQVGVGKSTVQRELERDRRCPAVPPVYAPFQRAPKRLKRAINGPPLLRNTTFYENRHNSQLQMIDL